LIEETRDIDCQYSLKNASQSSPTALTTNMFRHAVRVISLSLSDAYVAHVKTIMHTACVVAGMIGVGWAHFDNEQKARISKNATQL